MQELKLPSLEIIVSKKISIMESLLDGELTDELEAELDNLDISQAKKVDGYYYRLNELESIEAKLKEIEEKFNLARKRAKKLQEKMKDRLKKISLDLQMPVIEGENFKFKVSKGKDKLVINEACMDDLREQFPKQKVVVELDKDALQDSLLMGFTFEGASLEPTLRITSGVKA